MVNKVRGHVIVGDTPTSNLAPKHLSKQEFGKRVYRLMLQKRWTQSELARRANLPRDSVSTYVRGKSLPSGPNLTALADALGVPPEELLPNHIEGAIDADNPELEMKVSPNAPHLAWLRVNRLVTVTAALQIMEILNNDKPLASGK